MQKRHATFGNSRDTTLAQDQYKRNMAAQLKREWKTGDVYAPHDLSPAEMRKWSKRTRPTGDVFDILNVNPLTLYKVWHEFCNRSSYANFTEFLRYVRLRQRDGKDTPSKRNGSASSKSAQDRESRPASDRPWIDSECAQTS